MRYTVLESKSAFRASLAMLMPFSSATSLILSRILHSTPRTFSPSVSERMDLQNWMLALVLERIAYSTYAVTCNFKLH